jgi:excisionase family DNA binding protein
MNPRARGYELLTVKKVCELLQVHHTTVYRLIKAGKIPAFKIGADWRFRKDLIERWMIEQTRGDPQ